MPRQGRQKNRCRRTMSRGSKGKWISFMMIAIFFATRSRPKTCRSPHSLSAITRRICVSHQNSPCRSSASWRTVRNAAITASTSFDMAQFPQTHAASAATTLALLLLQGLYVFDERVDLRTRSLLDDLGTVAGFRCSVAVSPDGHLTRSMRGNRCAPVNHFRHLPGWKSAAMCLADLRQVGGTCFKRLCQRSITSPVNAVACHAGELVFDDAQMFVLRACRACSCTCERERQHPQHRPCGTFFTTTHRRNLPTSRSCSSRRPCRALRASSARTRRNPL